MNHKTPTSSVMTDRIFGVLMLLLAIIYLYFTSQLPLPFGGDEVIGPKTFPTILGGILAISGVWLALKPQQGEPWPMLKIWIELVLIVLSLLLFVVGLEVVGFIPMSILCSGFLSWRMGASPGRAFLIASIYCIGLFILFDVLLDLALPLGILEEIWS